MVWRVVGMCILRSRSENGEWKCKDFCVWEWKSLEILNQMKQIIVLKHWTKANKEFIFIFDLGPNFFLFFYRNQHLNWLTEISQNRLKIHHWLVVEHPPSTQRTHQYVSCVLLKNELLSYPICGCVKRKYNCRNVNNA